MSDSDHQRNAAGEAFRRRVAAAVTPRGSGWGYEQAAEKAAAEARTRQRAPNWDFWRQMVTAPVWQAVALSLNTDPDQNPPTALDCFPTGFEMRLRIAENHLLRRQSLKAVNLGIGGPMYAIIDLAEFTAWAKGLGWELPENLPWHIPSTDESANADVTQANADTIAAHWPWGHHSTALLGHLAAAAQHWWVNFDPSDKTTAPTNQQVSNWLQSRDVGKAMADKMATILRLDGLPSGPRK